MKAIAYIDGFNLYYGSLKGTRFKWLDIQALARHITPNAFDLVKVRYFTARVKPSRHKPNAHTDQDIYLRATSEHCPLVDIHYGQYVRHNVFAENANPPPDKIEIIKTEEKGSDVNLAVHLVHDACTAGISAAILISNDSDLVEAVNLTQRNGVDVYWFPPVLNNRYPSVNLKSAVIHTKKIYPSSYPKCQLPNPIMPKAPGSAVLHKPRGW